MVGLTNRDSHMEAMPLGSYSPSGIDVLIVGTGLGGLSAALECKRKGHEVRVLERNPDINVAGIDYPSFFFSFFPPLCSDLLIT